MDTVDINKKRNSSFELLRILTMILIILHHYACFDKLNFSNSLSINSLFTKFALMGGRIGVNIFVMITGYFMINSNFKLQKLLKLYFQVLFYSVFWSAILAYPHHDRITFQYLLKVIMPLTYETWWFATLYVILYILTPYINKMIRSITKEEYQHLLLSLFIIFSIIPMITNQQPGFSQLAWFVFIYLIAAYISLYGCKLDKYKPSKLLIGIIFIVICSFGIGIILEKVNSIGIIKGFVLYDYFEMNRLPALLISVLVLVYFKNLKISYSKAINLIASTTFGIYLFHEHPLVRSYLWVHFFNNRQFSDSLLLPLIVLFEVASIFILGAVFELIRLKLIEPIYIKKEYKSK